MSECRPFGSLALLAKSLVDIMWEVDFGGYPYRCLPNW